MGVKNTLLDLNDHLFEQMERLNDDNLVNGELEAELKRAKAMSSIAQQIINNGSLVLAANKLNSNYENTGTVPRILIGNKKES